LDIRLDGELPWDGSDRPENSGYSVNTHRDTYTTSHRKFDSLESSTRKSIRSQLAAGQRGRMAGWQEQRGSRGGVYQVSFWVRFRCFVFFPSDFSSRGRGSFEFELGLGLGLGRRISPNEERKGESWAQIGRTGIGWKIGPGVHGFPDLGFEPARRETRERAVRAKGGSENESIPLNQDVPGCWSWLASVLTWTVILGLDWGGLG
jgi:hypothetical protein